MITVILVQFNCYKEADYLEVKNNFDSLVTEIKIEKTSLIANSLDKSNIKIYIDSIQNIENIDFKGNIINGKFLESDSVAKTLNPQFIFDNNTQRRFVEFNILSTLDTGIIELILNLNNYTKSIYFQSIRNHPDRIEIIPNPQVFNRKRIENVEVLISLLSSNGIVSNSSTIRINAKDTLNNHIGTFVSNCNYFENSNKCNALFNIWPDTSYVGKINLTVTTNIQNDSLKKEIYLYTLN